MQSATVFHLLSQQIYGLFPEWEARGLTRDDSLKELGANSIDRAEILMMMMAAMKLKIPMMEFGKAKNLGELADIFASHV